MTRGALLHVLQYSVTLQSEEEISEDYRAKNSHGSVVSSYSKHHEFCLHTKKTHISVPIPLTASPGFSTDIGMSACHLQCQLVIYNVTCHLATHYTSGLSFVLFSEIIFIMQIHFIHDCLTS